MTNVLETYGYLLDKLKPGSTVLLKPNLLLGRAAETCVTTHPVFVKTIARLLLDMNFRVLIGDSPALGSTVTALKRSGYIKALEDMPVEFVDFADSVRVDNHEGALFRHFEIARIVRDVDFLINLPKIKTHGQMGMTLAVKNLFGCVSGLRKKEWHLKTGSSPEHFADMLLELAALIKPDLTIVDGIWGMEGNGPQNGTPVPLGFIAAGINPCLVDRVLLECLKIDPQLVLTCRVAEKKQPGTTDLGRISVIGSSLEECTIQRNFKLPGLKNLMGNTLPHFVVDYLKSWFTEKPDIVREHCSLCLSCVTICPTQAMSLAGTNARQKIAIDRDKCIHCFCCQEVCPENAVQIKAGFCNRLIRTINS